MQLLTISSEIYASAAVFYSAFASSKCRADDIPEIQWQHDDEIVHIYRTEGPWNPTEFDGTKTNFAFIVWVAVLSVAVSAAFLVFMFCVCWRFCPKNSSRRQSSNAALMPSRLVSVAAFRADAAGRNDGRIIDISNRTGSIYGTGVVNFAFTNNPQDQVPNLQTMDKPPEYITVVSQISPSDKPYPVVSGAKTVETPPPAYDMVSPFTNSSK